MLERASIGSLDDGALYIIFPDATSADVMKKHVQMLADELESEFSARFNVICISADEYARQAAVKYGLPETDEPDYSKLVESFNNAVEIE